MRASPVVLLLAASLAMTAPLASAHDRVCIASDGTAVDNEHEDCDGTSSLQFLIGWQTEPAISGEHNGPYVGITRPANGTNVEGVTGLHAQYEYGGQTYPLDLRPMFGRPGVYRDDIIPTRPGTYTLHFWGSVEGLDVNFTKDPETVDPASDLQFPERTPDAAALQQRVASLEQQVAAMKAQMDAMPKNGGVIVTPPGGDGKGAPGFEPLLALGAVAIALLAARRRAQP
ncbi:MAG TPA: hypothetical protein VGR28_10465 [Candidatus Thermoplasmatota archaeon]|nr:hypothetical protein [Candidatus Thermoplasmatota archaeon]